MSVKIIAEAGSNWRLGDRVRDQMMARALIEVAAESGADIVKFQTFRPETIYAKNAGTCDHLVEIGIEMTMHELYEDLAMPYEMISELAAYCEQCGIEFLSTPFSVGDFEQVDPYVSIHKIASAELHHVRLLEAVAQSGKPLLLSTGACTEEEIEWALGQYRHFGGRDVTLLQCTMQYPAEPSGMHLLALEHLSERFDVPVGLSDHSVDCDVAPVMAVALGASVIEKHFTIDNRLHGGDHVWTLTPRKLKRMVEAIRLAEEMRGERQKAIVAEEKSLAGHYRRGLQALCEISAGDLLCEGVNIGILRPGNQPTGLHPGRIDEVEGRRATCSIGPGVGIQEGDWE